VALGLLKKACWANQIWRWRVRSALLDAERVIVNGRDMAERIRFDYCVPAGKIVYAPNWSPHHGCGIIEPEASRLWRDLGLDGKFVVQYAGNMGLWHDVDTIVRAAHLLRQQHDVVFLMVGGGMRRAAAEKLSVSLGLRNVIWLPHQPRHALDDVLSCCQAALISLRAGLEGVAVPCKLYGIMAAGRPVIAQVPARSEVALTVQEEACGIVVPTGDAQALATAIRYLHQDRAAANQMGVRAFGAYIAKYSLQPALEKYDSILRQSSEVAANLS